MKLVALISLILISSLALAGNNEGGISTNNFCSSINEKTCAHLRFEKWPTTNEAGAFVVYIMSPSHTQVTDIQVKLWMDMNGHGHGSSPVKLEQMDELNHFFVQDAYFVMRGKWQVIVTFTDEGIKEKIVIPLDIKE